MFVCITVPTNEFLMWKIDIVECSWAMKKKLLVGGEKKSLMGDEKKLLMCDGRMIFEDGIFFHIGVCRDTNERLQIWKVAHSWLW